MNGRCRTAALVAVLLAASGIAATALAKPTTADTPRTLNFCFEETPALPWRSRQKAGLYFELLDAVARRLALRFEYHPQPWLYCLSEVAAGRMDGAFAVAHSPERLPVFAFPPGAPDRPTDVLRSDDIVLVRRRGSAVTLLDGRLLGTDRPVGVLPGYAIADDLKRLGWTVDMASRDHLVQLSRLARGELDAVALSAFRWDQLRAAGGPALDALEALPGSILSKRYFLGLSHAFVEANPALADEIWATTREVRTSESYRAHESAAITEALRPRTRP
jgi:polar amino acid transport system substrate-binding protein